MDRLQHVVVASDVPEIVGDVFTAMMPSVILNIFFGGVIAYFFLRPSWQALENDVREFIETAGDFK